MKQRRLLECTLLAVVAMCGPAASVPAAGTPIPVNSWVKMTTKGVPAQVVGFGRLAYASGFKRTAMMENYHQLGSEPNEALLAYDFTSNRWDVLNLGGNFHTEDFSDGGHTVGGLVYNPNQNTFVYYGMFSGSMELEMPLHTWWYDPFGQVGRDKHASPKPGQTMINAAAFDVAHNVYVFYGGETFTYDPTANLWQKKTPLGTPPTSAGGFPSMDYNSANQKVYMFGGQGGSGNDVYSYDVPTNTWTRHAPSGTLPPPRSEAAFAYDSTNNIFLLYGGQAPGGNFLNDTWVYDPVADRWAKLTPAVSPPVPAFASFGYLAYDSANNAFVMVAPGGGGYAGGGGTGYGAQTWLFRYAGGGPNAGTVDVSPAPTPGGLNRYPDGWAKEPVLAATGTTVYAGWIETGPMWDTTNATWPHVYASKYSGSAWSALGASFLSLDSESGGYSESHAPSIALVNGTPWISWTKANNSSGLGGSLFAKSWNGSSWVGGPVPAGNPTSFFAVRGRSQMADVGGVPTIAYLENDRDYYPWNSHLYVKAWNGSAWVSKGAGPLNRSAGGSGRMADSVSLASDGTNPVAAWTEYTTTFGTDTAPQVYVSRWNGSAWVALGGSLNVNASNWAYDVSIVTLGGQPYAAWTERSAAGNAQLFVKTWNGSAWVPVGPGTLNRDASTGWAYRPALAVDAAAGALYVGWVEQQALGKKAQVHVSKLAGGSWTSLGGTLNADPALGSAQRIALALSGGKPIAAWGEVNLGCLRQIYARQWNGTSWAPLATGGPSDVQPPSVPSNASATAASSSGIDVTWDPSTDNVGVANYLVYRDGALIGSSTVPNFSDTGLAASTSYTYTMAAVDAAGNASSSSSPVVATTLPVSTGGGGGGTGGKGGSAHGCGLLGLEALILLALRRRSSRRPPGASGP
jgi:hypothetical protein